MKRQRAAHAPATGSSVVALALLALAATALAAPPQTVYRCGPDGRVYSQTPCADGRPVTTDDPRTPGQRQDAAGLAKREAKTAQQLTDERRQREAAARGQPAIGIQPEPAPAAASAPRRAKAAREPVYVGPPASQPKAGSAKPKDDRPKDDKRQ